jgi:peptidoglycan glycosyltransferase
MNTPITRLYIVFLLLFGVLVVGTSWNTVFRADELRNKPQNRRQLLEQQRIRRGAIRAADGSVLARSVRRSDDTFTRLYPQNGLFAQAIGYSFTRYGRAGLEQSRNDALTGTTNELGTIFDRLSGSPRATTSARRSTRRPSGSRCRASPAARARSWRSTRRPARSR